MDRERRILDAAAALFAEKGFHGVGMDELGVRAGLTGPALYRHFSGKQEILAALFNEAMDELIGASTPLLDDPRADLSRMLHHHVGFTLARHDLVSIYQREDRSLEEPWRKAFDRRRRRYVERWETAVLRAEPGASPHEVSVAVQSCLGLVFSLAYWPHRLIRAEQTSDLVERFIAGGLDRLPLGSTSD